jgi:hypothetical protein
MKGDERAKERQIVFMCALEAVYALTRLLIPFIPGGAHKIFEKLNTALVDLSNVKSGLRNLAMQVGEERSEEEGAKKKAESYAEAQRRKKEKRANATASGEAGQKKGNSGDANQFDLPKVEIRVEKITKVSNHTEVVVVLEML